MRRGLRARGDVQKRGRVEEDAAAGADGGAGAVDANDAAAGASARATHAPRQVVRRRDTADADHDAANGGDDDGGGAGVAMRALPNAAARHNVDATVDRKELDEEDEEWQDENTDDDADDDDNVPEEIIQASDDDDDDDDDGDDEGAAMEGAGGAEGAAANLGGGGGKRGGDDAIARRVRFATEEDLRANGVAAAASAGDDGEPITRVWRSDKERLDPNVKLTFSNRAYESFFQLRTEFPCLSFVVLRDPEGDCRTRYPMKMYLACGTQAPPGEQNQIVLLQVSNLARTRFDEASDSDDQEELGIIGEDDSDDDGDDDAAEAEAEVTNNGEAIVHSRTIPVPGTVNRMRAKEDAPNMLALWCEDGTVRVVDAMDDAHALADFDGWTKRRAANWDKPAPNPMRHTSTRADHGVEGYGLAWSRVGNLARFASGDCAGHLVVWAPSEGGGWVRESGWRAPRAHSIEELVWSPVEPTVFIAARAGGAVEVWDTRDMRSSRVSFRADATDINVADWNRALSGSHLLLTGADSGILAVWDLRKVQQRNCEPLQTLTFHQGNAITSVEFSCHNETVFAATSADGQCSLWDLCVERDIDEEREMVGGLFGRPDVTELPDALMFQHQGLTHPKECHFHPQIPGAVVTTDYNGLHIWKPCNWKSLMK